MPKKKISCDERLERIKKYSFDNEERISFYVKNKNIISDTIRKEKPENSPKRTSARSLDYWKLRGFDENDSRILSKSRMPGEYEYFRIYKELPVEIAIVKYVEHWGDKAVTKINLIKKYGEELGVEKWNNYCNKQSYTNTFQYKNEKYGWTKDDFDKFNKKRSVTENHFIEKWGKNIGIKKWKTYCKRQSYTKSIEYYKEKYGECAEEKFLQTNLLKGHTFETFLYRFKDENVAKEKYNDFLQNSKTYSNIASELFDYIKLKLDKKDKCFYLPYNNEKYFFNNKLLCYVDFLLQRNDTVKKVIEFFGDYWHCNENIFKDENEFHPTINNKQITVKQIREKDNQRIKFLKHTLGDDNVLVVWESEYKCDKENTIKKCLEFLKK
jgi:hypothetical protein